MVRLAAVVAADAAVAVCIAIIVSLRSSCCCCCYVSIEKSYGLGEWLQFCFILCFLGLQHSAGFGNLHAQKNMNETDRRD